jgi:hypothetical protein
MRYPTQYAANQADHTYVKCSTGKKAWGCWGGKIGGTALRQGNGSTLRANQIAQPDETAGITCYLINGVCHQAANRILIVAGISVRGARGYDVSEALFGTYGRPTGSWGLCQAPFYQHTSTTGDLPECAANTAKLPKVFAELAVPSPEEREREQKYIEGVLAIYSRVAAREPEVAGQPSALRLPAAGLAEPDLEAFHLELFLYKAEYQLGSAFDKTLLRKLKDIRRTTERARLMLENWFTHDQMRPVEFVEAFNQETILFQEAMAGAMKAAQYQSLFALTPGDFVVLADPKIVKRAYKG